MNLAKKTSSGLFWSASERLVNQGIEFVIQILLARIVAPAEFGLLALITIFLILINLVIDGGLTQALVQRKELQRIDVSTMFFLNMFLAVALYSLLFLFAPTIANFFDEDRLVAIIRVIGLSVIIRAFSRCQNAVLMRRLEFRRLFMVTTPAIVFGGSVGIVLALLGWEVWALVVCQLVTVTTASACLWIFARSELSPGLQFSWQSVRSMLGFSSGILGTALVNQSVQNSYGLIVGKTFSIESLAFYNRARSFHRRPEMALSRILGRVLFPVFSRIQDDAEKIVRALRQGLPVIGLVLFPIMGCLICTADSVVFVLLTEKWMKAAEYMRWFPVVGMVEPIVVVLNAAVRGQGRAGLLLTVSVIKNGLAIGVLVATIQFGILAIVIGQVGVALAGLLLTQAACASVTGYSLKQQWLDVAPYLIATLLASGCCVFAGSLVAESHFVRLPVKVFVFVATYFACCSVGRFSAVSFLFNRLGKLRQTKTEPPA